MFRITADPSSGRLVQCFVKYYKNDSIVSVDMDKFGVMAAYYNPMCVCVCARACSSLPLGRLCTWHVVQRLMIFTGGGKH